MRHRDYNALDDQEVLDGDRAFHGVNMIDPPNDLQPGEVAEAVNCDFTQAALEPRKGVMKLPWTSRVLDTATGPQPFETIYGATEYEANDGVLWQVVVADGRAYRMKEGQAAAEIQVPPGSNLSLEVTFANTSNGLCMFRGEDEAPLLMPSLDVGFQTLVIQPNTISGASTENSNGGAGDGSFTIPNIKRGDWIGNRLFFPFRTSIEKDLVGISDYLNATRHAGVRSQTRINQGSGDTLLRVVKHSENRAVCLKSRSIYVLNNVYGNLDEMRLDVVADEYGLAAEDAVTPVGKDLWILAYERGIVSITQTQTNQLQGVDVPVSRKIHPLIERINWPYASKAVAITSGNDVFFAVPLDDARGYGGDMIAGASYSSFNFALKVETGKLYRWIKGANDVRLENGAETITSTGFFTANGPSVNLVGLLSSGSITAQVQRVYEGVNNAILHYNTLRGTWYGHHEGGFVGIKRFVRGTYAGRQRVLAVTVDGFLALLGEADSYDETAYWSLSSVNAAATATIVFGTGAHVSVTSGQKYRFTPGLNWDGLQLGSTMFTGQVVDFIAPSNKVVIFGNSPSPGPVDCLVNQHKWILGVSDISGYANLRAYGSRDAHRIDAKRLSMNLRTSNPEFRVTAVSDGANEEWQVSPKTGLWESFSRTKYRKPWNKPAWEPSNSNDDHGTPFREDYSVVLSENTVASGSIQPGQVYLVQGADPSAACSIMYDGQKYDEHETFIGVSGVATFTVFSGVPLVYSSDSFIDLGENGVQVDLEQETSICRTMPAKARGLWVQPKLSWRRGRAVLTFAGITMYRIDRAQVTKV